MAIIMIIVYSYRNIYWEIIDTTKKQSRNIKYIKLMVLTNSLEEEII